MRKFLVFVVMLLTISPFISLSSYQSHVSWITSTIDSNEKLHATFLYDTDHHESKADNGVLHADNEILGILLLLIILYTFHLAFVSRNYLHAVFFQSNYLITFLPLSKT